MDKERFSEGEIETRKERKAARRLASKKDQSKYKKTDQKKRAALFKKEIEKKASKKKLLRGRVLEITPDGIFVEYSENIYVCVLRGLLKREVTRVKNLVTVGDFVLFDLEEKGIMQVEPRHSILSRAEHLRRHQEQLIAANIDQVLITISIREPSLKPALVDRYIIAAYKGKMEPVIVVNKMDLLDRTEKALFDEFVTTYHQLGIPVITLSVKMGEGIEKLKEQMRGKVSVFAGQSGVGKSSLINAIAHLDLPIGTIVHKTQKGSHTTSSARLIPLEFGGWCVDTPGIRSFGIWDLRREDLDAYFPEIEALSHKCKYPNCTHTHEPNCSVKNAVGSQGISPLRFESYLKLLEEIIVDSN